MTTKEIKELALKILNRNGESGIKKSDFTVRQAKQLIKEYNLGWMKQKGKKNMKRYGNVSTHLELTEKAFDVYSQTSPLSIYEKENEDGSYLYDVRGCFEAYDLTSKEVNEMLEELGR